MIDIDVLISESMKKTSVYRLIKSEFLIAEKKHGKALTEDEQIGVLKGMIKEYDKAIETFNDKAKRPDLAAQKKEQQDIIKSLLPEAPSDDIIKAFVKEVIDDMKASGTKLDMSCIGTIKKIVTEKYPDTNGKIIADMVKSEL